MQTYDTITEAIKDLTARGYTTDFNLKHNTIECSNTLTALYPGEFVVDYVYRFEGMTDPADEMVLYAISSPSKQLKGLLLNAYGIYSEPLTDEMVAKLQCRNN